MINKVWLDESQNECISCGLCESVCPEVFEVPDKMVVKTDVDFNQFEPQIKESAETCPTEVIRFE